MILLALVKSLSKRILQFTINVSIKAKWINLRKPWFTKGLLNPQGRKICYISLSLITLTLPMKMHISRTKTNLLILFELLSVHIMKNKLKSYKLLGKFLIEIKESVVYHPIQRKQLIYLANDFTNIGPNLASKIPALNQSRIILFYPQNQSIQYFQMLQMSKKLLNYVVLIVQVLLSVMKHFYELN